MYISYLNGITKYGANVSPNYADFLLIKLSTALELGETFAPYLVIPFKYDIYINKITAPVLFYEC